MNSRIDPDLEKILPLLPLRDAATLTPERARAELVALAESRKDVPLPELASVKDITVDGADGPIAARLYASGKMPAPTVVYFHGGGWVAGDSAGGNLAAGVAQASRSNGPRLAAQFLVYPATDLLGRYGVAAENAKYPSRQENADGYFLTGDAMRFFASQYLPRPQDSEDARASPLRGTDLAGLPRAVICTAEFYPLRDEGEAYAEALKRAGVEVAYFREPGMVHGYFGMGAASL